MVKTPKKKLKEYAQEILDIAVARGDILKTGYDSEGIKSDLLVTITYILSVLNQVDDIESIYDEFIDLIKNIKKQVVVEIISAIELDKKTLADIKERLDEKEGLKVRIKNTVDRSIIGGLVLNIGDRVVDLSVKGKIEDLKDRLKSLELEGEVFG